MIIRNSFHWEGWQGQGEEEVLVRRHRHNSEAARHIHDTPVKGGLAKGA
jgi:hypothetical protein